MYYIIIPKEIVEKRGVFADKPRTKDGSAVITPGDLRFTRFSYGKVQLLNDADTALLLAKDEDKKKADAEEGTSGKDTDNNKE